LFGVVHRHRQEARASVLWRPRHPSGIYKDDEECPWKGVTKRLPLDQQRVLGYSTVETTDCVVMILQYCKICSILCIGVLVMMTLMFTVTGGKVETEQLPVQAAEQRLEHTAELKVVGQTAAKPSGRHSLFNLVSRKHFNVVHFLFILFI